MCDTKARTGEGREGGKKETTFRNWLLFIVDIYRIESDKRGTSIWHVIMID